MKRLNIILLTLLFSVFTVSAVLGQALEISGTVTENTTGDGLPGANVAVKGTNLGAATDRDGNFSIRLPNFSEATLVVSFIGYITQEITVTASTSDLNIGMDEDVLKVSEVVVTGLATSVKRRNLANAVGTVSSKELIKAPAQTLERALSGKMAGIMISQNTGAPGGGINVNLRGTSTVRGSTQPLYVVDGVIVSGTAIQSGIDLISQATGAGSATPQGQPTNRIADMNPNDIERIEVLKGASAAAIYGSKATNGVILITTKSGTVGKPRFDVTQQIGFSSILNKIGTRTYDAEKAFELKGEEGRALFNQNGNIDQEDVLFGQKGLITQTTLSVRGGSERTQFYLSGLLQDEDAIVKNTDYQKIGGRLNIDHKISDRIKLSVYTNFARTQSNRGLTGNANVTTATFGFALANTPSFLNLEPDENGVYPTHPYNPSNPVETRDLLTNRETVNRTMTSMKLDWDIMRSQSQSLAFIVQAGLDYFSMDHTIFAPNELQYERDTDLAGTSVSGRTESTFSNLGLNLTHNYNTSGNIIFRTTAGLQFENRNVNNILIESDGLVQTQSNVDQATKVNLFQTRAIQRERGFFVQEEIDLNEKIYLTAALRGDASSANGDTDKYFLFPKFSGSVRLSAFSFWDNLADISSEFKLRAAYGETGNLPGPLSKFSNLIPLNISGKSGLIPSTRRGDPNIKPERTKEFEVGFDATILNGNGTLELTHYRQNISDLILLAALPPSSGFSNETINAGKMRTTGWEVSLGLTPIRSRTFNWTSRINFFTTDSKITQLDVDPFNTGGFATYLGGMRIQEGYAPNTIIGAETVINDDGTIDNILGNELPDYTVGFSNNFNFGNFEFSFLLDLSMGAEVVDLGLLITDLGGTSGDYDEIGTINLPDGTSLTGKMGEERINAVGTVTAPYVSDADYLKLRELSLSYSFPSSVVDNLFNGQISYLRVGIAGRNLLMFTPYTGYDPEVSQFGNIAVGRAIDTLPYPSSRQLYFNVAFGL